ncbi:hypothetical protein KJE20_14386, partial [Pyrenophora tritici-repentis]
GASGLAGVIKTVLSLEKAVIPPIAMLENVNPDIDVEGLHLTFPKNPVPWPATADIRRASVSSFGYGGSNAHVILDDAYNYLRTHGLKGLHQSVSGATLTTVTAMVTAMDIAMDIATTTPTVTQTDTPTAIAKATALSNAQPPTPSSPSQLQTVTARNAKQKHFRPSCPPTRPLTTQAFSQTYPILSPPIGPYSPSAPSLSYPLFR